MREFNNQESTLLGRAIQQNQLSPENPLLNIMYPSDTSIYIMLSGFGRLAESNTKLQTQLREKGYISCPKSSTCHTYCAQCPEL